MGCSTVLTTRLIYDDIGSVCEMKKTEKPLSNINPEEFLHDLEMVSDYYGTPLGRLQKYWNSELEHVNMMSVHTPDALRLIRAFQCLFLESIELLNLGMTDIKTPPDLPFYKRNFVPHMVHLFQQECASDLLATHGYPLSAFAMLRNTFDHILLILAVMLKITDFYDIEGMKQGKGPLDRESRRLRKETEQEVKRNLTGQKSGLSVKSIENLKLWDDVFDLEVHGARLSHASAAGWIQGDNPRLNVHPEYNEISCAMYSNRISEITWLAHRLLPMFQNSSFHFSKEWAEKWRVLDLRFEDKLRHLAAQQEDKVGLSIIEFVKCKLPFDEHTHYPLEGTIIKERTDKDK